MSTGGGQPNLNQDQLKQIKITCPTLMEQIEIVAYIDTKIKETVELENSVKSAIDKLKEYRISLITAAVTGQIDVRDFVQEQENEKIH
jgi:type I restriction enzyme S subunit